MPEEPLVTPEHTPDASDVVEGPVGSASLWDPATPGPAGADLNALEPIVVDRGDLVGSTEGSAQPDAPPDERQDRDHMGIGWELAQRDSD